MINVPQLNFSTYFSEMFWVFITIILINIFLSFVVFPKIQKLVYDRNNNLVETQKKIDNLKIKVLNYQKQIDQIYEDYNIYKQNRFQQLEKMLDIATKKHEQEIKKSFDKKYTDLQKNIATKRSVFENDMKLNFKKEIDILKNKLNLCEVKK